MNAITLYLLSGFRLPEVDVIGAAYGVVARGRQEKTARPSLPRVDAFAGLCDELGLPKVAKKTLERELERHRSELKRLRPGWIKE